MKIELLIKILVVILLVMFFLLRNLFVNYYKKLSYKFLIKYIVIIIILLFYFSGIIDFALFFINIYLRLGGLFLIFVGYLLFFYAHSHLGKNWSTLLDKKITKKDSLIKTGPYKSIRHPTYSASILTLIGFGVLTSNWLIFLVSFIILIVFYCYKVPREEKFLIEKFGKEYVNYKKITGGFLPKL